MNFEFSPRPTSIRGLFAEALNWKINGRRRTKKSDWNLGARVRKQVAHFREWISQGYSTGANQLSVCALDTVYTKIFVHVSLVAGLAEHRTSALFQCGGGEHVYTALLHFCSGESCVSRAHTSAALIEFRRFRSRTRANAVKMII